MNDGIWDLADVSIEGVFTLKNDELLLLNEHPQQARPERIQAFLLTRSDVDYL